MLDNFTVETYLMNVSLMYYVQLCKVPVLVLYRQICEGLHLKIKGVASMVYFTHNHVQINKTFTASYGQTFSIHWFISTPHGDMKTLLKDTNIDF